MQPRAPATVAQLQEQLPGRVSVFQDKVTAKVAEVPSIVAELRQRVVDGDADKLRDSAKRNAETFFSQAQAQAKVAQEKAVALYADLVARGEQVVGRSYPGSADHSAEPIHAEVVQTPVSSKPAAESNGGAAPRASKGTSAKSTAAEKPASKPRARKTTK
jgi:hypothetical protein